METVFNIADKREGGHYVYCKYVVRNGHKYYPTHGRVFKFWGRD